MTHGEAAASAEFAAPGELETLYNTAAVWLDGNGHYFFDPAAEKFDDRDGIPIADASEVLSYKLDGQVLRYIAPKAVETLGIGSSLELVYQYGYYSPTDPGQVEQLTYEHPVLSFVIVRDQQRSATKETIDLWPQLDVAAGSAEWRSLRISDPLADGQADSEGKHLAARVEAVYLTATFDRSVLAAVAGFMRQARHRLSRDEAEALQDIVDRLDEIRAGQDEYL